MSRGQPSDASPPAYVELQAVTNFSFLEGGSHPHEIVAQATALGYAAIGIADRNTLAGIVRAHVAAKETGLRLIVGTRLDLEDAPRLLCYPTDRRAYGRLTRLLSLGQGRAEKGSCRLTLADVVTHAEGAIFIVLPPPEWDWRSASASSRQEKERMTRPCHPLAADQCLGRGLDEGEQPAPFAAMLQHVVRSLSPVAAGLYLAASHAYRGDDRARIGALGELARTAGIGLVATGDILYHAAHRRPLQDVLTCIRHGVPIQEAGLRLAANGERHLKTPAEMARLFRGFDEALANTVRIADACRFSLNELVYEYPDEPVPPDTTPQAHLAALTWEGAYWRFPGGIPSRIAETIRRELSLIDDLGYAPYFLTVHDIVHFARSRGILCQGRGSAANSVVCFCLAITAVDPTEVDLLFERFISEARREPPDIDVDFEHERREEVIQYIYARYGRDRAGLAATVISYRARSAVRDVGKAMGLSEDTVAALAGMVWGTRPTSGKGGGALPETHVREAGLDPAESRLATVLALADELIGFPRHLSQHVGGFVLTRGPLVEMVPVGNAAMQDRTFIEWDKDDIAALGLLKVDVLALGMLSCIRRAFDLIRRHHGETFTLASVPRDDPAVYDMLCRADSIGVFQVESRAQMNMLPRLKPRCFYDLVIEVAIVRPGPIQGDMVHPYLRRRSGLEAEVYPSPAPEHGPADELRQILSKTKGVPLFQEQAMRIAMVAARFSDAEVNELRKAMATFRRRGTIGLLEEKMVSRMVTRGYDPVFAQRCFAQIKGFGEYGFPESHAASFAHLVYVSAWLKHHYPAAFCAAILNAQPMGFYAPAQLVRDAREHGVEVRAVDVNGSAWDATLEDAAFPPPRFYGGRAEACSERGEECIEDEGGPVAPERGAASHPRGASGEGIPPPLPVRPTGPTRKEERRPALRLGLRQIDGLQRAEADRLVLARAAEPFRHCAELQTRAGIGRATLEKLAAADAFRSLGLDRRQALWDVKGLVGGEPLPLFTWGAARDSGAEEAVVLPAMRLSEHVVNDYQTLRLSLKAHPMSFFRPRLRQEKMASAVDIRGFKDGAVVRCAGVILVRQRPGTAKGVVFMTLEDETGVVNAVVWPKTLERFRKIVMTARLIAITGRIQRHEDIIHVVAGKLEDLSPWLRDLTEQRQQVAIPIARADEVIRPEPGSARDRATGLVPPRPARHPRDVRVLPKSRDFH
jgi:error-prone DNA polymerase